MALYIASIFYLMVLGIIIADKGYNLELFWELKEFLSRNTFFCTQILRNILVFIPIYLLAYYASRNIKTSILLGLVISIIIEFSQLVLELGSFEFDDIVNNTIGTIIGLVVSETLAKIMKNEKAYTIITLIGAMIALVLSVYANVKY